MKKLATWELRKTQEAKRNIHVKQVLSRWHMRMSRRPRAIPTAEPCDKFS